MGRFEADSRVRRSRDQVSTVVAGEAVILGLHSNAYFGLDGVGLLVWQLLEAPRSVAHLHAALLERFAVDSQTCLTDLLALLDEMADEGLIEPDDGQPPAAADTAG